MAATMPQYDHNDYDGPPTAPAAPGPPATGGGEGGPPASKRRQHPSQTARTVALVSSVAATLGVGAALARADRPAGTTTRVATAPSGGGAAPAVSTPSAPSAASASAGTTYADGTYTGPVTSMRWGDVQVRVTVQGGKIVSVDLLEAPEEGRSGRINQYAGPILDSEAVAAQSRNIDAVSGATYTSEAYATSLQAALDQAAGRSGATTSQG